MTSEPERKRGGPSLWRLLGPFERTLLLAIGIVATVGLALIADGAWIKAKASVAQILLERSFAAATRGATEARPWPWADFETEARITAPRIARSAVVLRGASGEALAFGPALLSGTPLPGEEGTAVIAAHRDTHFSWLKDVRRGDRLEVVRRDGRRLVFIAGDARVVRWDQNGIDPHALGRNLVLSTCWPFDANSPGPLRYILEARLEDNAESIGQ